MHWKDIKFSFSVIQKNTLNSMIRNLTLSQWELQWVLFLNLTMESTLKHQMFFNQVLELLVPNIWIQQRCAVIISKVIQRFPGGIF